MTPKDYVVTRIDGEYAYLKEIGNDSAEDVLVAMFLLPPNTDIGTKLHYEMLEYTLTEE
ncbi:MAG: hypothetical protein IKK70_03525 [Clostridia bacterium]|nr:hypothetical protein [Clostridia bacterium]